MLLVFAQHSRCYQDSTLFPLYLYTNCFLSFKKLYTLIKKIAAKLKKFLGSKSKDAKVTPVDSAKSKKITPTQPKAHHAEKPVVTHPPRKPYKKETREEYRLRHEKLLKNQPEVAKTAVAIPTEDWDDSVFKVDASDGKTRFHDLEISKEILHAVYDLGFQYCSQVQAEVLPKAMTGDDITAQA